MSRTTMVAGCLLSIMLTVSPVAAEAPAFYPVQGILTDADGVAIDGSVSVRFTLYDAPNQGKQLWTETQTVIVEEGAFVAYLGFLEPLAPSFFVDNTSLWLAIAVEDDPAMQRVFLASVPFSGYAEYCGQAPEHQHDASSMTGVVPAGQSCELGQVVTGFDADGKPLCTSAGYYSGENFALSGQSCWGQQLMVGIDASGFPVCTEAMGGQYSGADFALSGQSCYGDEVVTGISGNGNLTCDSAAGGGLDGSGTSKYLAKFKSSDELEKSIVYESSGKVGLNTSSPSQTLEVKGNLKVSGEIYWGGNKFTSSSCLVVGGTSCSSACSAHGMSCYKAFAIDKDSTSTSCSQSGFKFCCCKD